MLIGALLCTGYMVFVHDKINFTDIIFGVIGVFLWIISGLVINNGVIPSVQGAAEWNAGWLMWLLIALGAIIGIIVFTKIVDVIRTEGTEHIGNMNGDMSVNNVGSNGSRGRKI